MLRFAFSRHCPLDLATRAGVFHLGALDANKHLSAFGLPLRLTCQNVGALGTTHRGYRRDRKISRRFLFGKRLAHFRRSGDAVVRLRFGLSIGCADQRQGTDGRAGHQQF